MEEDGGRRTDTLQYYIRLRILSEQSKLHIIYPSNIAAPLPELYEVRVGSVFGFSVLFSIDEGV